MKKCIIKSLYLVVLATVFAACGNRSGNVELKDTVVQSSSSSISSDTTHTDSIINNGERLQGTDTSARQRP